MGYLWSTSPLPSSPTEFLLWIALNLNTQPLCNNSTHLSHWTTAPLPANATYKETLCKQRFYRFENSISVVLFTAGESKRPWEWRNPTEKPFEAEGAGGARREKVNWPTAKRAWKGYWHSASGVRRQVAKSLPIQPVLILRSPFPIFKMIAVDLK